MLIEGFVDRTELLHALLGVINLSLHDHQRPGEVLDHLRLALLELLLPAAEFLEFPFLFLDLFLLALELDELLLRFLHLIVQMLYGFLLLEVQEWIGFADSFGHGRIAGLGGIGLRRSVKPTVLKLQIFHSAHG